MLGFSGLARADEPKAAIAFKGIYEASFIGIPFAKMGMEIDQTGAHYSAAADIASSGIVNLFTKHTSHTTVKGAGKNFHYSSIDYETHYKTNKKKHYVAMGYENGALDHKKLVPPEPKGGKRPPVPQELQDGSVDPLSIVLTMRAKLIDALKTGKTDFTIDNFDGRRLTRASFHVVGKKTLHRGDDEIPVVTLTAKRAQIAGFTKSEIEATDPNEPLLYIYLSDDARLWPIRLEAHEPLGTFVISLAKECSPQESCLLGITGE